MIGGILFYVIVNATLFSFIFWILTFILKYYYSNKNFNNKFSFYECGFKSLTNIKIQYNINFILLLLFLLIYDGEFLILIPFALNITIIDFIPIFILILFIILLMVTLLLDFVFNTLEWQI